jgi:regulatory Fis family protein
MGSVLSGDRGDSKGGAARPRLSLEMEQGRDSPEPGRIAEDANCYDAHPHNPAGEPAREEVAEYLHLIRWAMHKAPELLRALKTAYLLRPGFDGTPDKDLEHRESDASRFRPRSSWRTSLFGIARPSDKLQDVEREHIRRILRESATAVEAALKLGINNSTLWRKRKRYNL